MDPFLAKLCKEVLSQHERWEGVMLFPTCVRLSLLIRALHAQEVPIRGYQRKLLTDGITTHYLYAVGMDEVNVMDAMGRTGWDSVAAGYYYWLPEEQKTHGWSMLSMVFPFNDHLRIDKKELTAEQQQLFDSVLEEQSTLVSARLIAHKTAHASTLEPPRVIRL